MSSYGITPIKEIAAQLSRSESSIFSKLHHLRTSKQVTKKPRSPISRAHLPNSWSDEEINFLISNYRKLSGKEFAEKLKRSEKSVASRLHLLRQAKQIIRIRKPKREKVKSLKKWSAEEINFLITNYGILPVKELAAQLNRSKDSISSELGVLRKSGEITQGMKWQKKKSRTVIYQIILK